MSLLHKIPSHPGHGYAGVIMLLVVVVIIMVVILTGPMATTKKNSVPQAIRDVEKSKAAACAVNRNTVRMALTQFQINNPSLKPTIQILQKISQVPGCPGKGAYLIGKEGEVYCTEHFAPPAEELQELIKVTPSPTPASAAQLFPPAQQAGGPGPITLPPAATPTPPPAR